MTIVGHGNWGLGGRWGCEAGRGGGGGRGGRVMLAKQNRQARFIYQPT